LVANASNEGGFGDTELEGNLLEFVIGHRSLEQNDYCRITTSLITDKCIDPPQAMAEGRPSGSHDIEIATP